MPSRDDATTVMRFIQAVNRNEKRAILASFDEESVFHDIPIVPAVRRAAIRDIMKLVHERCSSVDWRLHGIAQDDEGRVPSERTDRRRIDDAWIEVPSMEGFEIRNEKISARRECSDPTQGIEPSFAHARAAIAAYLDPERRKPIRGLGGWG